MEPLTKRFLELCDYLITNRLVKNDREIAKMMGVTPGSISDIRNGRKDPGIKVVQGVANSFAEANIYWLLTGAGDMVNAKTPPATAEGVKKVDTSEDKFRSIEANLRSINKVQGLTADRLAGIEKVLSVVLKELNKNQEKKDVGKQGNKIS